MSEDWECLGAEFCKSGTKSPDVVIVFALATIVESLGGFEAGFDIGFGNVEPDDGFDFVTSVCGGIHNGSFFAGPTADGGKN